MSGFWWKILGVVIFFYVIIGGLTIPTKAGMTTILPNSTKAGQKLEMTVTGYNTHFQTSKQHRAWLKLDSTHIIQNVSDSPISENSIHFSFDIPNTFPERDTVFALTLIVDNETDGTSVQPNAIFVNSQDSLDFDQKPWQLAELKDLHVAAGIKFPYRNILNETIRNTFFHVALWFAMFILLMAGLYHAILYLNNGNSIHDIKSASYNRIAIMYGIFGLITGSIWAKFTWNTFWTTDIKLNMTAVAMLIYLAYLVLRGSTSDHDRRAKISASYSVFAFLALIPLVFVIPRMTVDSLHPGNGGNPALGGEDLDHTLRMFFYPSIIGLTLLGNWMVQLLSRYDRLKEKVYLLNNFKQF